MLCAFDLGTKTGYAFGTGGTVVSGVWDFSPRRYEGGGMRYLKLRRSLDEAHKNSPISEIVFEEVRRHMSTDAAHVYGGLLGVLTSWCEDHKIPYTGVPVGTIKKHATGSGNASKAAIIAWARARGFAPVDDNEADALAILDLRQAQIDISS